MNRKLLILTAGYFVFLLIILLVFGYTPCNDGDGYIKYAIQCLSEKQPYPTITNINNDSFIWNIGSINLIALSIWIFNSIYPVLVLLCLMKAFIAYFTSKIAQFLFGDRIAIISLLIYILYPNNWGQSTTLLSEIPAILFSLCAVYIMLVNRNKYCFFAAGLLFCISNWFRSTATIFIICFIIFYLIYERKALLRKIIPVIVGFSLGTIILGTETYIRTGYFISNGNSLWYNMALNCYDGAKDEHFGELPYQKGTPHYIENMNELNCYQRSDIWKKRSLEWINNNKIKYLSKIPKRIYLIYKNDIDNLSFALPDKSKAENNYVLSPLKKINKEICNLQPVQYLALINFIFYIGIILLFIDTIYLLVKNKQYKELIFPLSIIIIGTISISLLIHGETRFKAPFMSFIIILASYSIHYYLDIYKIKKI